MSYKILAALTLCGFATGCDMVPPGKMVVQTARREPIPVRDAPKIACNVQFSVAKCKPLWKLVSQWCVAWNNIFHYTKLMLIHPLTHGENQSFQHTTKLIVETQIFRCMFDS